MKKNFEKKSSQIADEKKLVQQQKKIYRQLLSKDLYNSTYIGNLCVQTKLMMKTKQNFLPLLLQLQFS